MAPVATGERKELAEEDTVDLPGRTDLSRRSHQVLDSPSFLLKWLAMASNNPYHRTDNPEGIVNLGTAENKLCEDILTEKLSQPFNVEGYMNYYFTPSGDIGFRQALASFVEDRFKACDRIDPNNVVVSCGCGSVLDMLSFALGEEGDYFLSATPHYPRVRNNLEERAGLRIYEVPLTSERSPGDEAPFQLTAAKLEAAFHRATQQGKRVRGLVLLNPNNPLGDVYSEGQLRDILNFAAKYGLHVICDEIYGLSVYDEQTTFTSVLSLKDIPDPERLYFVWGFSKDFALAGYRCGMFYTRNNDLLSYCKLMAYYQAVPILIQRRLQTIISDKEWLDRVYFPTNLQRIRKNFAVCKSRFSALGIPWHPCKAGLFVWFNVQQYMSDPPTFEDESRLFEELISSGVYCVPGRAMSSQQPGWMRIIFTVTPEELTAGLNRIQKTLLTRKGIPDCVEDGGEVCSPASRLHMGTGQRQEEITQLNNFSRESKNPFKTIKTFLRRKLPKSSAPGETDLVHFGKLTLNEAGPHADGRD